MFHVKVLYFKLKNSKTFVNGNLLESGTLLVQHPIQELDKTLYNTVEEEKISWFYASDIEVEFIEERIEKISEEDLEAKRKMLDSWL